jgi:hypothetical protein
MNPDVALALKYGADYEQRTTGGWQRAPVGVFFCMHGCDTFFGLPAATWVARWGSYAVRTDAACDEHAARAGVPAALLSQYAAAPRPKTTPVRE